MKQIGRPFQAGHPGGPGRQKGSRNKLAEAFLDALHKDFLEHGKAAMEAARQESPLGYCRMVAGLLPQKLEVSRVVADLSDDELLAIIRAANETEPILRTPGKELH